MAGDPAENGVEPVIRLRGLHTRFGRSVVHESIDLDVHRGEIFALIGGSGAGKTVLTQAIIMLRRPQGGSVRLLGEEVVGIRPRRAAALRRRFGVLFQHGALFTSLTVLENIALPLHEHSRLPADLIEDLARLKLAQVGLPADAAGKYPEQLSGGMIKRAALARALALEPELVFLDEPTAGLDPKSAGDFDELILRLRDWLGLTVFMVTHDIDSLWRISDRVAVLGEGRVIAVDRMEALAGRDEPQVRTYFEGPRGRAARPA